MAQIASTGRQTFEAKLTTVLVGIAVQQGEDWQPIPKRIKAAVGRRATAR